jgi:two-component system NtrC family sensor kinase
MVVEDREKMRALVEELQRTNKDLEAAHHGLVRSEKLAGTGRLAAGLSHEIGNPLQIVMGYVELLRRDVGGDARGEIIDRMDQELRRIHDILSRLLEFAQPIKENVETCDLNAMVTDMSSLLEGRKAFQDIEFTLDLDPQVGTIRTEPEKLRQVLVNLIFNAADALSDSHGRIVLRTARSEEELKIEVQDSGHGIPKSDLEKVFDPFFTTKEPGKGTGLGLPVCLSLVDSLGGSIEIHSTEGEGTVVTVRLPKN